ncbi:hypothetical protein DIPPA_04890 [Diplonema papillatum]|nr:hypothetical protein DIPPA_04890 [Diplonema papillatum]
MLKPSKGLLLTGNLAHSSLAWGEKLREGAYVSGTESLLDHRVAFRLSKYSKAIRGSERGEKWRIRKEFEACVRDYRRNGAQFGIRTAYVVLRTYALLGDAEKSQAFFDQLRRDGHDLGIYMWTTLLLVYKTNNDKTGALRVVSEMEAAGVAPDAHAASIVLAIPGTGSSFFETMIRHRVPSSAAHANALLSSWSSFKGTPLHGSTAPDAECASFLRKNACPADSESNPPLKTRTGGSQGPPQPLLPPRESDEGKALGAEYREGVQFLEAAGSKPDAVAATILVKRCGSRLDLADLEAKMRAAGVALPVLWYNHALAKAGMLSPVDHLLIDRYYHEAGVAGPLTAATHSLYILAKSKAARNSDLSRVEKVFAEVVVRHRRHAPLYTSMLSFYAALPTPMSRAINRVLSKMKLAGLQPPQWPPPGPSSTSRAQHTLPSPPVEPDPISPPVWFTGTRQ